MQLLPLLLRQSNEANLLHHLPVGLRRLLCVLLVQAIGCEASLLATDWYLCLYATSLPAETAARVWDALFLEGRKVLHRMGLALLGKAAPQLMKLDNAGGLLVLVLQQCQVQAVSWFACSGWRELMSMPHFPIYQLPLCLLLLQVTLWIVHAATC